LIAGIQTERITADKGTTVMRWSKLSKSKASRPIFRHAPIGATNDLSTGITTNPGIWSTEVPSVFRLPKGEFQASSFS
jgi:hypothetical protein